MRSRAASASLLALALAACTVEPTYRAPVVELPATFKEAWVGAQAPAPAAASWWREFDDPVLDALEAEAGAANQELASAAARYDQARALLRQARSDAFPQVGVGASISRERVSANRPLSSGSASTYDVVELGASASYELDLFGRVRSSIRAQAAGAQAAAQDVEAVRLALQAQLASAYMDLRGLDARTGLLRETVQSFDRASELTRTRHDGGIASGVDVGRAEAQAAAARAELSAVAIARQRDEHAIAVLVGRSPSAFSIAAVSGPTAAPTVPDALPSTLLRSRPDVVAAERRVASANSRIGVARAAIFPAVTLGGSGGVQASRGDIFSTPATFWALGPLQAVLSIFDGGRRKAQVRQARAEFDEAAANYRQAVLTAFREVEDDLAQARLLIDQERDQRAAAEAAGRTRDLALTRYKDGATDYLEVVTAQTAALDADRALLEVRTSRSRTAVDLYRAVGGNRILR